MMLQPHSLAPALASAGVQHATPAVPLMHSIAPNLIRTPSVAILDPKPPLEIAERVRFRNQFGRRVVETDVIVTTIEQWAAMPQAQDEAWQSVEAGALVIAHRLCG